MSLGFAPHRAVNILGFNSKEWFCANQGTIMAGGIAAGIYASNLPDACHYISEHSEAEVVVVDGAEQLVKYKDISKRLPHLKALVVYGDPVPEGAQAAVPIYSFEDFQNLGKDVSDAALDERISAQRPEECCSLIYTSGTVRILVPCLLAL
jgi:long-chain-fatty-acid--CoA ligase ACSBG